MGRSLSPILRRELENLDKDADSRKSAMKALKSYVKDLDSKAIPVFLAQVSETKQPGTLPGEHTISLYEVLARVHGPKIVPQIDNIMSTIVKTLSLSSGAFALHQACSKVVPAIARYAIDPTTTEEKKRRVIHSLCKPLSDCLLGSQEYVSSGAALCLQALVKSDNWRFASSEMVNEVCQRVAAALDKHSRTNSHMAMVTALAKHNGLIVEAYARLLIKSGLQIVNDGFVEANSQKQLSAIHMICSVMRYLDPKSILSELDLVIKEMDKCQADRMPFVTGAASEALEIAKRICGENCSKSAPRREISRKNGNQSPFLASPESQTVESPNSMDWGSDRSVNRKLWGRFENGVLDVSLKDGIFSYIGQGSDIMSSEYEDFTHNNENFTGFVGVGAEVGITESSPQRSNSHISVDDVKIFTTPRKLIRSLQDLDAGFLNKQVRMFGSSAIEQDNTLSSGCHGSSESVSSTEDVIIPAQLQRGNSSSARTIVCAIFVALLAALLYLATGNQDDCCVLVPT